MEPVAVDSQRVLAVIQRDNPQILERAMMIVRLEDLAAENAELKSRLETPKEGDSN